MVDFDKDKQIDSFLSKITKKSDITRLQIHVLLDYTDFHTKFKDPNNSENDIKTIIDQYTVKEQDIPIPIYMFNFSFRNDNTSIPPTLLLPNNIKYNELTEIIKELNTKNLTDGGSKKTKRSLPKHKKQKTEKKKNYTSEDLNSHPKGVL